MLNAIDMSRKIKDSFVNYINTSFDIADEDYRAGFLREISKDGAVAKGPYLEVSGSYEFGKTIAQMMENGEVSEGFRKLEPIDEKDREIKLYRPLYLHQEQAIRKAGEGKNLVVTTGTGSGKTECFLIPVLNELLQEKERGTLSDGVRVIIVYPMNALANDQLKRIRKILKGFPEISYGMYTGNTRHSRADALGYYHRTYRDNNGNALEPMVNELICRDEMRKTPPNILITNYSMLEYMLLRPNDADVFRKSLLKYIILDEAHIYKGATGIETSLLMRRLRARINAPENIQYILTSATLGGKDADNEIISFAQKLCGTTFNPENIIRSVEKDTPMKAHLDFPAEMFEKLTDASLNVRNTLNEYCNGTINFGEETDDGALLYELCLNNRLFASLRYNAKTPIGFSALHGKLSESYPLTENQLRAFVEVCARAVKNGAALVHIRYHFFVRALEGAFITLNAPKSLYLNRLTSVENNGRMQSVFEAGVCRDCGRIAVYGTISQDKTLCQTSDRFDEPKSEPTYFVLKNGINEQLISEGEEDEESHSDEDDFEICPICATICSTAERRQSTPCSCGEAYIPVKRATATDKKVKCPACETGEMRRFYLGYDAATSVLATELFEQLPETETIYLKRGDSETAKRSVFTATAAKPRAIRRELSRQFLCFSDSRMEAAYFAAYMDKYYQDFLRRRGIWKTAEYFSDRGRSFVDVSEFVKVLANTFFEEKTFMTYDSKFEKPKTDMTDCEANAWIAVLNEMYNARRKTSLSSMGIMSFEYIRNDNVAEGFAGEYGLSVEKARALLELLVLDAVYSGSISAGSKCKLNDAQREFIFFTPSQHSLVKVKNKDSSSTETGWCPRARTNGKLYPNNRIARLVKELNISESKASELLDDYWENVFCPDTENFILDANDFRIKIGGAKGNTQFYRCALCGRVTSHNVNDHCSLIKCSGRLEPVDSSVLTLNNHYANLYKNGAMKPLFIKEHTAQLSKEQQRIYQESFINQKINALSCSTTFEMGVDAGSLETVYMRDVPPSPANYVQRAGRAGRSLGAAAFVMTYAKLSSHDFTYYDHPENMISGKIYAPIFELENEKVIRRHIYAVAISAFLAENPDVYGGDNATVFLNGDGYERLVKYLEQRPEQLTRLLKCSIPDNGMHDMLGINDFSWTDCLIGEEGVLNIAVSDFRNTVNDLEKLYKQAKRNDTADISKWQISLRQFRKAPEDNIGKNSLIDFLVRANVLPKYGFPVDTVELSDSGVYDPKLSAPVQLSRDLQQAIAEYAPGSEIVADGRVYTSRYIRKNPNGSGWETGYYCEKCSECGEASFTKEPITGSRKCVHCGYDIPRKYWSKTLEPRRGFIVGKVNESVPLRRPERDYKTDDYYIGDTHSNTIKKRAFIVNDKRLIMQSTFNDSLVVVGKTKYCVCSICGYAAEDGLPMPHKNSFGYYCKNKDGKSAKYLLSHDFKTDVVKLTFCVPEAAYFGKMISVLYALLEGLSNELGIERTDIKGCLFRSPESGSDLYSVILYDAVAGGAGHVRRIVNDDGDVFERVLSAAIRVVAECECDTSCYKCLRNYYNQKIHDDLNRKEALAFLREWQGEIVRDNDNEDDDLSISSKLEAGSISLDKNDAASSPNPIEEVGTISDRWQKELEQAGEAYDYLKALSHNDDFFPDKFGEDIVDIKSGIVICTAEYIWNRGKIALINSVDEEKKSFCESQGFEVYVIGKHTPNQLLAALEREKVKI